MNSKVIFHHFAKKWNLAEATVTTIYLMIQVNGNKYGKTSRVLESMGVRLLPRQLKYFVRRVRFTERIDVESKGRPHNYSELLRNNT